MEKGKLPAFNEDDWEGEYGFANRYSISRRELPGVTWETGNMFGPGMNVPNCNMEDGVFNDTVWRFGQPDRLNLKSGFYERRETLLSEIFYSDAVRRLQAVEQLTLPPEYSTIPNTAAFSRFEHIWGSVLFVRQMAEKHNIPPSDTLNLELRTLLSDIAHTTGSHLGDWMFQGVGGGENQHDKELGHYLEVVGINDILRKHDVEPAGVIFPEAQDWVEADQPDLCVDRVDYGLREMNRWNDAVRNQAFSAEDFVITPDNMLAISDQRKARVFSEGFLLLSQEHWSEPTHRFLVDMLMLRAKLFYAQGNAPDSWVFAEDNSLVPLHEIHPRDLMYVTDPVQAAAYALPDLGGHILDAVMTSVAKYRRQYVWPGRSDRIYRYMDQFCDRESYKTVQASHAYTPLNSPNFDSYKSEYPEALPLGFAILDAETAESSATDNTVDIAQPPFKLRQIDPLVKSGEGFKRLSELDPSYKYRLNEHKKNLETPKVARLSIPNPRSLAIIRSIIDNVEPHWHERLSSSRRMSDEELRGLVAGSSREVHGSYPFMTFLEY